MNKYQQFSKQQDKTNNTNNSKKEKFIRVNQKIKAFKCRIIEEGVSDNRIMDTQDAIDYALSKGLDLVEVRYDFKTGISTAKICDWGKFQYEQKQREKAMKKAAKANQQELKCLQMSLTTDTADLNRMIARAKEFLTDGDRVKLTLRFRGMRELQSIDLAKDLMKNVLSNFDGLAVLDSAPVLNGKELSCIIRRMTQK